MEPAIEGADLGYGRVLVGYLHPLILIAGIAIELVQFQALVQEVNIVRLEILLIWSSLVKLRLRLGQSHQHRLITVNTHIQRHCRQNRTTTHYASGVILLVSENWFKLAGTGLNKLELVQTGIEGFL